MVIDPKSTEPFNIYKLLIGSILPRPIAFVSTMGADGIYNLAPFSFFTAVSANPPCIAFAPMLSLDAKRKDTLNNAERLGEFVVNVVSEDIVSIPLAAKRGRSAQVAESLHLRAQHALVVLRIGD